MNKRTLFAGAALFLVCLTIIIATLILANGNIYIKNLGTSLEQNGKIVNSISVTGDGKVYAVPDMANITVTASELASTSKAALENASNKISRAVEVMKQNGVDPKDIQTSNLSVSPEYDYTSGGSVLKGQRATVSVTAKVKGLDNKASKATAIIDGVSQITNIQISSLSFDIEDKTSFFTQARKLAFDKAKQKASELAGLAGVKLLSPVSITDSVTDVSTPSPIVAPSLDRASGAQSVSSLSSGQLEITVNLSVLFGIE